MTASLFTGFGSKLAEQWVALVLTPAFAFWAGGVAAWAWGHGRGDGWEEIARWFDARSGVEQAAVLVGAFVVVSTSAVVVQRCALAVIRVLEGYWPRWLEPVRGRLVARRAQDVAERELRFNALEDRLQRGDPSLTPADRREHATLDRDLRRIPTEPDASELTRLMPTRLGNVLRASESWPVDKYGLDPVKCWSRLWLVLPPEARTELAGARSRLDAAAAVVAWGLLFVVWTIWAWWALPAGVLVACAAYVAMVAAATSFGDLIEAAVDVYRFALYDALRWPRPAAPDVERAAGEDLTRFLWRGTAAHGARYAPDPPAAD